MKTVSEMNFSFGKRENPGQKESQPRRDWLILLAAFFVFLVFTLSYFGWFFYRLIKEPERSREVLTSPKIDRAALKRAIEVLDAQAARLEKLLR